MSDEKPEEKSETVQEAAPEPPLTPQEQIARALKGIQGALVFIAALLFLNQCQGIAPGESKESKALGEIGYELRIIAGKLGNADASYHADLRQLNETLSNLNSTIWNKSCSR